MLKGHEQEFAFYSNDRFWFYVTFTLHVTYFELQTTPISLRFNIENMKTHKSKYFYE